MNDSGLSTTGRYDIATFFNEHGFNLAANTLRLFFLSL